METFMKRSKFLKCFITNITASINDIEIWCQTDTKVSSRVETSLDLVHNQLSDLFAISSQNLRPIPTPEVGRKYLTHMKNDLHFHRVFVTHIDDHSGRASVLFIDFGVEDWVPFNHLVEFDELFEVQPLAQKFFLADIQTKDDEWNSDEVKRCLKPFLMSVFQCEVIAINKNTECLRVYDQFFNQPLVQHLVKHCNGFLTYPSIGKEIFEAIDLSIDRKDSNKTDTDSVQINGFSNQQKKELKSTTVESFPKHNTQSKKIKDEFIANKENVCPITKSRINGNTNELIDEEMQTSEPDDKQSQVIGKDSSQESEQNEEILDQSKYTELNNIPKVSGEPLSHMLGNGDDESPVEQTITQELEVIQKETNDKTSEEVSADNTKECNSNEETIVEEVKEMLCNGNDVSHVDQISVISGGDSVDSPKKPITEETDQKQEANKAIDLCPNREFIGQRISIYLTTNLTDKFYAQLSSQFDAIQSLTDKMTEFYNKIYRLDTNRLDLDSVKPNDIIAARFSGDGLWYRASVKANTGTHLKLIYIDFGNEETVEVKECKQLVEEFGIKDLKPMALLCQTIGEKISAETVDKHINDMSEVISEFVDYENDCFKIKILSVK